MTYPPTPENPAQPEGQNPEQGQSVPGAQPDGQPAAPAQPEQPAQPNYAPPQYQQPSYQQPQQPQQPQAPYAPPAASLYPNQPQPQYASAPAYAAGVTGYPGPGEPFNGASDPEDLSRPLYGATFSQAIRRFFKNYANFSGRASRSEYWWIVLFGFLVELIPMIIYITGAVMLASASASSYSYDDSYGDGYGSASMAPAGGVGLALVFIGLGLVFVLMLAMIVPSLAIAWRRFHDANFAGPFYFLSFIPYAGPLVVLVFMFLPPSPLGRRFDRV